MKEKTVVVNDISQINSELEKAEENVRTTLLLGGKTLDFYPKDTVNKEYNISNNDSGTKRAAFFLKGEKNITIDGQGAILRFHGELLPFLLDGCENITVKNLSVDYPSPFYSQAQIVSSGNGSTELRFSDGFDFEVYNGELLFRSEDNGVSKLGNRILVIEFNKNGRPRADIGAYLARFAPAAEKSFLDGMTLNLKAEKLTSDTVKLSGVDIHRPGGEWVCTYADRNAPGFFLTGCKNVTIENVTLYHTASMGVVAQLCEDVALDSVRAVPEKGSGRFLSVSADATHFVNCTGKVTLRNCVFTNMLDDACNVHGIYTVINELRGERELTVGFRHFQQYGVMLYRAGDEILFIDRNTMTEYAKATVKTAEFISPREIVITIEQKIPDSVKTEDAIENRGRMPEVLIENCVTGDNRPRGFLLSTPKRAVVRGCRFFNMYHGIHICGDCNDWFESGPVRDLEITDCTFDDSAFCGGAAIQLDPRVPAGNSVAYHKNVTISGNTFTGKTRRFLYARNTGNIVFSDNTYKYDPNGSDAAQVGSNGIDAELDGKKLLDDIVM